MSSAGKSLGTQSPPLEANPGGEQPMGVSSIRGDKPQGVPDKQQRQGYFPDSEEENTDAAADMPEDSQRRREEKIKTE